MPINFPTFKNLIDRTRSGVRAELPESDPTIFGSFFRALSDSTAARSYDLVLLIKQALNQFFPQTAQDNFLERWAGYEGLSRLAATPASGEVVFSGTAGVSIPVNTQVRSAAGNLYITQAGVSITNKTFNITSLTCSRTTVTATAVSHPLANAINVTISGADESEYNGTFKATVIDNNTFTYEITGTPGSPANGTITGSTSNAVVNIESEGTGQNQNLDNGATVTIVTPIPGIEDQAFAKSEGVIGGTDLETDDELRARVLQARANPVANFNEAAIIQQARTVPGVTRVFVKKTTPSIGDVTIYFFRDNDVNPIPSVLEIKAVRASILKILPATSHESNIYVRAPKTVATNFKFTAISPDTPTMRAAIKNNLQAFFEDEVVFETDVAEDKYKAAIIETQDTETGEFLQSFTLSSPKSDIAIKTGQIAVLKEVSFS